MSNGIFGKEKNGIVLRFWLGVYKKIYFQFFVLRFCTALLNLFKLKSWFLWNCTEVFQMHELQYFDLELTFNCLLSINEICWFWWSEQKKRKNCLKFSIFTDTWMWFMTKLKYLFHFFVHILVESLSWIFSDFRSRKKLLEKVAIEKRVFD